MSTWFKLLPLEIDEVTNLIEPTDEIKDGETVAGVISDDLKKIWTLSRTLKKSAELMEVESKYSKASPQDRGKIAESMSKARALECIFWIGVIDELHLWGHPEHTELRVGWQVVEFKPPELPMIFKFPFGSQQ
jgi:hypothetical protein